MVKPAASPRIVRPSLVLSIKRYRRKLGSVRTDSTSVSKLDAEISVLVPIDMFLVVGSILKR